LVRVLRRSGLGRAAIDAAWPDWWSPEAEGSESAQAELRFSLARKLGLDPRSLLQDDVRFVWRDEAKFKQLSTETVDQRAALSSFGVSIARALVAGTPAIDFAPIGLESEELRFAILINRPYVELGDLVAFCWGVGIPVVHLRVFPLPSKRMCAMTVRIGERFAVILGKDVRYPAQAAYYLAHEIGHIALSHLADGSAVVDLQDPLVSSDDSDEEEVAADQYSLRVLTGHATPTVLGESQTYNAPALARATLSAANELRIEAGTLALCFGHSTGAWQRTMSAMNFIYGADRSALWTEINNTALQQLDWSRIPHDSSGFLRTVMGLG
jgi:hypothetical protein